MFQISEILFSLFQPACRTGRSSRHPSIGCQPCPLPPWGCCPSCVPRTSCRMGVSRCFCPYRGSKIEMEGKEFQMFRDRQTWPSTHSALSSSSSPPSSKSGGAGAGTGVEVDQEDMDQTEPDSTVTRCGEHK